MSVPQSMSYLWEWFKELSLGRPQGLSGAAPIPSQEIAAWVVLRALRPTNFELDVLRLLDAKFREFSGRKEHS